MNIQKYASVYAAFHRSAFFRVIHNDTVVLEYQDHPFEPYHVTRLFEQSQRSEHNSQTSPFVRSACTSFKIESTYTLFLDDDSFTILLGNERVLMPTAGGKCKLYATPFFVQKPAIVEQYLQGAARSVHDNTYAYKSTVLYLDRRDLPFPGGDYFATRETHQSPCSSAGYRICVLSDDPDPERVWNNVVQEWRYRQGVRTLAFPVRDSMHVSPPFVFFRPIAGTPDLADEHSVSTSTVRKRCSLEQSPQYLLQDVLDSYADGQIKDLGLIVEFPIRVQYDGSRCVDDDLRGRPQFVALTVNGSTPKRVLYARAPYERYVEYDVAPRHVSAWTEITYSRRPLAISSPFVRLVSLDSVAIGIETFEGAFLCFDAPLLLTPEQSHGIDPEWTPSKPCRKTNHVDCLLNLTDKDVLASSDATVLDTYQYDCSTLLHRLRLRGVQAHDLWCLSEQERGQVKFPKYANVPPLVTEWLRFFSRHRNRPKVGGDVQVVKLAIALARHGICFKTKIVPDDEKSDVMLDNKDVVLQMTQQGADFVNGIRLERFLNSTGDETGIECKSGSRCLLM